jgi:hypothetical protein
MTAFRASPIAYIIPAIILGAVVLYYLYGAIDRAGLGIESADAVVTGKQFTAGGVTYSTNIVGGRAWTQAQPTPDAYVVLLRIGDERSVGLVPEDVFEALGPGDRVRVKVRRTRLGHQLEVVEVSR